MTPLLASLAFALFLPSVLFRPEPNLQNHYPSSVGHQLRGGSLWHGKHGSHVSTKSRPLGVATPRWQTPLVRSNKVGGRPEEEHGSHPAILLNQLDPANQVLFLEKFSLLNPVQQAFAFNQFFSTAPDVQTFAINQFITLEADLLVRSVQAEMEKMAEANPDEVKKILDGAQPELKLNSAVVVKLPIGRVCRDQQWVDGWGLRTLHRDCETGVVYNINVNVNIVASDVQDPVTISPGGTTTADAADPSTVNPTTDPTTEIPTEDPTIDPSTEIPTEDLTIDPSREIPTEPPSEEDCEATDGECPLDWITCPEGKCIPPCLW